MSRREREQRIQAAAPKRAAYLAGQGGAASGGDGPSGAPSRWSWQRSAGLVIAVAMVAGGVLAYYLIVEPWWDRRELLRQSGRPQGAMFGDGVVALFDSVDVQHEDRDDHPRDRSIDKTRVTVFDRASGARVAQFLFDSRGGCAPASPGRRWCDLGPLAVHDARTFARLARFDDRVAETGGGRLIARRWMVAGPVATGALDDGRAIEVDAATLAARVVERIPDGLRPQPMTGLPPVDGAIRMASGCDGGPAARLTGPSALTAGGATWTVEDRGGRPAIRRTGAPPPDATFLEPTLLAAADGAPLIAHHASLEAARDHGLVSRLGPDGAAQWTVDLGARCTAWKLDGTNLVIVTDDPRRRALAIDAGSGAIRWARSH